MTQNPQAICIAQNLKAWTDMQVARFKKAPASARCEACGFDCKSTIEKHTFKLQNGSIKSVHLCPYCHFYINPYRAYISAGARLAYVPELPAPTLNKLLRFALVVQSRSDAPQSLLSAAAGFLSLVDERVDVHRSIFSSADIATVASGLRVLNDKARAVAFKNMAGSSRIYFSRSFYQAGADWWETLVGHWAGTSEAPGVLAFSEPNAIRLFSNAMKQIEGN